MIECKFKNAKFMTDETCRARVAELCRITEIKTGYFITSLNDNGDDCLKKCDIGKALVKNIRANDAKKTEFVCYRCRKTKKTSEFHPSQVNAKYRTQSMLCIECHKKEQKKHDFRRRKMGNDMINFLVEV